MNTSIVSLKLGNNEITSSHYELLKKLVQDHPSLTHLDFSNNDTKKHKNKLGNDGFSAIMEGIRNSRESLISIVNFSGNFITNITPLSWALQQ